jgi:ubiquitin carboxyl-terminal hydrolase L3
MNDYVNKLGFSSTATLYEFTDVFGIEDWALEMIPQPVAAVIMLYPLTEKQLAYEKERSSSSATATPTPGDVWFIKQRIGNACGTIGLLHALLNAPEPLNHFQQDSWLQQFQHDCPAPLDPVRKAEILEGDETIANLHDQATSSEQNQTSRGSLEDDVITHFVALVCKHGALYELDGRKAGPVSHGPTSQATLLQDACRVVKEFMARDPDEIRFTILALAPKQG